jgi:hypothetical protein
MTDSKKTTPLSPDDMDIEKAKLVPDVVIRMANELLVENWTGSKSMFTLDALKTRVKNVNTNKFSSSSNWDIEYCFRAVGWDVSYYDEIFEFKKSK